MATGCLLLQTAFRIPVQITSATKRLQFHGSTRPGDVCRFRAQLRIFGPSPRDQERRGRTEEPVATERASTIRRMKLPHNEGIVFSRKKRFRSDKKNPVECVTRSANSCVQFNHSPGLQPGRIYKNRAFPQRLCIEFEGTFYFSTRRRRAARVPWSNRHRRVEPGPVYAPRKLSRGKEVAFYSSFSLTTHQSPSRDGQTRWKPTSRRTTTSWRSGSSCR